LISLAPSADIRRKMEAYGWSININEQPEERDSDWSLEDSEDDYRYSDEYGDGDDEYDIDNDIDFWRRAGD
jgi:hypothetical protein